MASSEEQEQQDRQRAREIEATDGFVAGVLNMDPDMMDSYIEENINTIAEVKAMLKILTKALWVALRK